jgi:hypothetical protein
MLTLLGAGQGQNSSFDADYQAVLNKAVALTYPLPTPSQQIKQNNLVLALKAGGIWNKLDVLYIFANDAVNGFDFGRINWKNPNSYLAQLTNPLTFTANQGLQGNGSTAYIDTTFNPTIGTNNYKLNNASRYLYMFMANGTNALDGIETVNTNRMLRSTVSTQTINQGSSILNATFNFNNVKGMKSIHRTSATNVELFNGISGESKTATSTSLEDKNQFILRSGASYGAHQVSMYSMGESLISENTAYVTAFDNYINSL